MEKPHLSASQLSMLARCPAQYERRYVRGERRPPGVAMLVGSATHEAIEGNLKNKMATGFLHERDQVADAASFSLRKRWAEEAPVQDDETLNQGEAIDQAVMLSVLHHDKLAPAIEPVAIERRFVIETEIGHDIVGVVDIEEGGVIRDTKTAGKSPAEGEAAGSVQGDLYTLEASLRGQPKTFALDFLVKTKLPKVVTQVATKTANDHASVLRRVEVASRQIISGIFPPTAPGNWWCSKKWCGYWDDCAWGAKQSVSVGLVNVARLKTRTVDSVNNLCLL